VQDALASPALQATAKVTSASHFFDRPAGDISPDQFTSDIQSPSVVAFIKTRNRVFALTRDTSSFDYDKNGDAVLISLRQMADEEEMQHQINTCQLTAGCVILTDLPASTALEVMDIAEENGWLPRPLPGQEGPATIIKALRQDTQPPAAAEAGPQDFNHDKV
jgi:hypothetical protein